MDKDSIEYLAEGREISLPVGSQEVIGLGPEDVVIDRIPHEGIVVAAEDTLLVALETVLTEDLVQEGLARELVNKVQNMRKTAGLKVTDRIKIVFRTDKALRVAIEKHSAYVKAETLCLDCTSAKVKPEKSTEWNINGHRCAICLTTVAS